MASPPISPGPLSACQHFSFSAFHDKFLLSTFYFPLFIFVWSLLCIATTELWYRAHDAKTPDFIHWSVNLPDTNPTFQKVELPPRTLQLLKYDLGNAAQWQEDGGVEWSVYFFRWQGKSMQSIMNARYHRPEICLPAGGLQQVTAPQTDYLEIGSLRLPFQKSTFSAQGRDLYVFYCLWQDGDEKRKGMRARGPADRLLEPLEGSRRFGQQTIEIIVSGYSSLAEAERAVRQRLPELIQIEAPAGPSTSLSEKRVSATAEEQSDPTEPISSLKLSK